MLHIIVINQHSENVTNRLNQPNTRRVEPNAEMWAVLKFPITISKEVEGGSLE